MGNLVFAKDVYRYYGAKGEPLKKRFFRSLQLRYLCALRRAQTCKNPVGKMYYKMKLRRLMGKTLMQIPAEAKIGEGFYIGHLGNIVINPKAVLGKNVNITSGVNIGQENRGARKGTPTIGDNVWIGTNAVVVGNITIGSDVLIAPLSFVNFDVPDHSIVVGNPAKVINKENATEGYINNVV